MFGMLQSVRAAHKDREKISQENDDMMDIDQAKELLQYMADGINPLTGEILPDTDLCNQPDIIRALHTAVAALEKAGKPKPPFPENAGKPWSAEDDKTLSQMYDSGMSTKELAERFQRSRGAITSRLVRLGKMTTERHG